jgi:DNA-binding NarL/FixJ family response regulator
MLKAFNSGINLIRRPVAKPHRELVIVSPDQLQARLLQSLLYPSLVAHCRCKTDFTAELLAADKTAGHCVAMFDCLKLKKNQIIEQIGFGPTKPADQVWIVLYNVDRTLKLASWVKRCKIRGIAYSDDAPETLVKATQTVAKGRLWLSRKMLSDCVRSSRSGSIPRSTNLAAALTRRETEILSQVALGKSNQQIAELLNVRVTTVKTHIYRIFKKIEVTNRLEAAMWASANLGH